MAMDVQPQIGVAFLSSRALPERLAEARALLPGEALSLIPPDYSGPSYLAGSDAARTEALLRLLADPTVRVLLAGRGGYGAVRLDLKCVLLQLGQSPKPLMGFSDVTALLALWHAAGVPALHGPVLTQLPLLNQESLARARTVLLEGVVPPLSCPLTPLGTPPPTEALSGPLVGGNLSVLQTLIGLEYEPDYTGKIVLLEDVNEPAYKLDRMCTHLLQASTLSRARAVVLGEFVECGGVEEAFTTALPRQLPLFRGFPAGHGATNAPFLWGARASIETEHYTLTVPGGVL